MSLNESGSPVGLRVRGGGARELILDELAPPAFVLLDAARDERIYPAVFRSDCEWTSLYRGDAASTMAEVAPYLVELDRESLFTDWLFAEGWGNAWGIFLQSQATLEVVRNHLRRFVLVQLPDERTVYFRFYDPRVLRAYLPTCTAAELDAFLGPVDAYLLEDEEGAPLRFARDGAPEDER
jgi:hypothetical protein